MSRFYQHCTTHRRISSLISHEGAHTDLHKQYHLRVTSYSVKLNLFVEQKNRWLLMLPTINFLSFLGEFQQKIPYSPKIKKPLQNESITNAENSFYNT